MLLDLDAGQAALMLLSWLQPWVNIKSKSVNSLLDLPVVGWLKPGYLFYWVAGFYIIIIIIICNVPRQVFELIWIMTSGVKREPPVLITHYPVIHKDLITPWKKTHTSAGTTVWTKHGFESVKINSTHHSSVMLWYMNSQYFMSAARPALPLARVLSTSGPLVLCIYDESEWRHSSVFVFATRRVRRSGTWWLTLECFHASGPQQRMYSTVCSSSMIKASSATHWTAWTKVMSLYRERGSPSP